MNPLAISFVVLLSIFGSALIGLLLRHRIPDEQLNAESKEVVKLVIGIVGIMTSMVLGLLVASAKSSFDDQRNGVAQLAANTVVLDRALAHYGPESQDARDELRTSVADMIQRIWSAESPPASTSSSGIGHTARYDAVYEKVLGLRPKNDAQRATYAQALKVIHDTAQMRWLLYSQRSGSIPLVFLVLMVSWLAITFGSYGLFAPRQATTYAVLLVGSLVVSSAVFLILELDDPFAGVMHISSEPLRNALLQIEQ